MILDLVLALLNKSVEGLIYFGMLNGMPEVTQLVRGKLGWPVVSSFWYLTSKLASLASKVSKLELLKD